MGKHLDLDDVAAGHPLAMADLRELRANQCAQFTGGEVCQTSCKSMRSEMESTT